MLSVKMRQVARATSPDTVRTRSSAQVSWTVETKGSFVQSGAEASSGLALDFFFAFFVLGLLVAPLELALEALSSFVSKMFFAMDSRS